MREPLKDRIRLQHIIDSIDNISRYTDGKTNERRWHGCVANSSLYRSFRGRNQHDIVYQKSNRVNFKK